MQNNIGTSNRIRPPNMVAVQLSTFTPVGIAMSIEEMAKNTSSGGPIPTVNMWCPQTPRLRTAMATLEAATNSEPKIGLRETAGMLSDTMGNAGKAMLWTSGWPNAQKMPCHRTAG